MFRVPFQGTEMRMKYTQGGARSELALGLYPFALNRAKDGKQGLRRCLLLPAGQRNTNRFLTDQNRDTKTSLTLCAGRGRPVACLAAVC